jgi:hypothetical protein
MIARLATFPEARAMPKNLTEPEIRTTVMGDGNEGLGI